MRNPEEPQERERGKEKPRNPDEVKQELQWSDDGGAPPRKEVAEKE